ncbi:MAG: SH3 domain-containing protein [Chloroflexi bacterium]|nr:SH3 domain-containing protein [Chloroflexota bacterium]
MDAKHNVRSYDWFKFVVAVILALIALLLLLRSKKAPALSAAGAVASEAQAEIQAKLPKFPSAGFEWKYDAARGVLLNPEGRAVYRLDPDLGKWVPELPDDLRAKLPEGFQIGEVDGRWQITAPDGKVLFRWNPETLTWEAVEETSTAGTAEPTETGDCAARPARLKVGDSAKVLTNLNLRSSPGIGENWLLTMPAGTVVEVIGGPECLPYGDGAYRWWQVRLPDGRTGWAAEAPIHGDSYFLEPVK